MPRLTSSADERHPVLLGGIRIAAGVWLLFISAALLSIGDWWGAFVLVPAALLLAVGGYVIVQYRR